MKPVHPRAASASLIGILLLFGCGSGNAGGPAPEPVSSVIGFQEHSLEDVSPKGANTDDLEASFAIVKLKYLEPRSGPSPEILAKIRNHFHALFFQDPTIGDAPVSAPFPQETPRAMDELRSRFFSNFTRDVKEMGGLKYSLEQAMAVAFQGDDVLSLEMSWSQYWGGAHGMSGRSHLVISKATGETIPLSRVIRSDAHHTLMQRLEKKAREHWRTSPEALEDLENQSPRIPVTENYWMTDAGVGFYYAAGEIGAYAMGEFAPFFRWSEVADIVVTDGPAASFQKKEPDDLIVVDARFLRAVIGDYNHVIIGGHFEQDFDIWGFGNLSDAQESKLLSDKKLEGERVQVAYRFEEQEIPESGGKMTIPVLREISFPGQAGLVTAGGLIEKSADFEAIRDYANRYSKESSGPNFVFTIGDIAVRGNSAFALALIQAPSEQLGESAYVLLERRNGRWVGVNYGSGIEPPSWYPFQ